MARANPVPLGMVIRALGYGQKVGVVHLIKGAQLSGEAHLRDHCPQVTFHQMGTGFAWDAQDRSADIAAAEKSWAVAEKMLADDQYDLVVLDEIPICSVYISMKKEY